MKRKPPDVANFWPILADGLPIFLAILLLLADFEPILAKETPEFFDKIKAGELHLTNLCFMARRFSSLSCASSPLHEPQPGPYLHVC